MTEEKKRELEHNAEETYGENEENVGIGQMATARVRMRRRHVWLVG